MSRQDISFLKNVTAVVILIKLWTLNIYCEEITVNLPTYHTNAMTQTVMIDNDTTYNTNISTQWPDDLVNIRKLSKQRRRALIDSLISQIANNSGSPRFDWSKLSVKNQGRQQLRSSFGNANNNYGGQRSSFGNVNNNGQVQMRKVDNPYLRYRLDQNEKDPLRQKEDEGGVQKKETFSPQADTGMLNVHSIGLQLRKLLEKEEYTNVTVTTIGRTAEYNEIVLLQAAEAKPKVDKQFRAEDNKYADDIPQKKIIFIVHGLAVMGFKEIPCLIVVKKFLLLLKYYFEHLDKFDIFIVPMANPDGVAYSYHFPLWNKNVSPQDACPGVALDRNFDVAWPTSLDRKLGSCNQQFPGDHPFSEPESQAIRDVLHQYSHKIIAYIHVHGGGYHEHIFKGDAVLYPKGYTDAQGDDDRYIDMKAELDEVMKNASFKTLSVTIDTLHNWYGQVFGSSVDYASSVYGIPFALEFVMQLYEADPYADDSSESLASAAQGEIWHRLIDGIFNYIYKAGVKHQAYGGDDRI